LLEGRPSKGAAEEGGGKTDDTGYESGQSKEQTPEREIRSLDRRRSEGPAEVSANI
jgi:hypothetical protein